MKSLFYAIRQVLKLKWTNLLKVVSLTLGIVIGGVIMCRTAFYNSFETSIPDHENTYFLVLHWNIGGEDHGNSLKAMGPMAPELMAKIPSVKKATRFVNSSTEEYSINQKSVTLNPIYTDSLFFDVFGFEILAGDLRQAMSAPNTLIVSESAAKKLFPDGSAYGKQVMSDTVEYTIGAIFKDVPRNSHLNELELVHVTNRFRTSWAGGDSYSTYFKTDGTATIDNLNKQINEVFSEYYKNSEKDGYSIKFSVDNLTNYADYESEESSTINLIFTLIGWLIIIVSALNFALMEINSLVSRAKEVGVHKTNGASTMGIFGLVIWETIIYVVISLILATVFTIALSGTLEGMMGQFDDIFALEHLWALGVVLLVMIALSGVLPAIIFARIPAMTIYRTFTGNNTWWKQGLVLIQFTISMITVCLLIVVYLQYQKIMHFDLGYNYDNLQVVEITNQTESQRQTLRNELLKMPQVEAATYTDNNMLGGWSGAFVGNKETGSAYCSARVMGVDEFFFDTYGIKITEGSIEEFVPDKVAVNQRLIRLVGSGIADDKFIVEGRQANIVFSDFRGNLFTEQQPMVLYKIASKAENTALTIRTKPNLTEDEQKQINQTLNRMTEGKNLEFTYFQELIYNMYSEVRQVMDGMMLGSAILLLITFIGTVSYLATDIRKRNREIAIRRTFGSSQGMIVRIVARRILIVALISTVIAIPVAYILGEMLLQLFSDKIALAWWIFALGISIIFAMIIVMTYAQTWKIARRDYVKLIGKI